MRSVGKLHRPANRLFHFIKEFRFGFRLFVSRDCDRSNPICSHASSMQDVNTHVHEGAAASQLLVEAPGTRTKDEAECAIHEHEWTKILLLSVTHQLAVIKIEVQAIANCQLNLCCFASGDHTLAVRN